MLEPDENHIDYVKEKRKVVDLDDINNAPTIEERPTGEWIYDEKLCNWKCSNCSETPKTIGYVGSSEFMIEHFKYCNHCGSEMKGTEE